MASDAQFGVEGTRYTEPKQRSWLQTCLIGCLIIFVFIIVIVVLATIWVTHHWRGLASDFGSAAIKQVIDTSELPPQQRQAIGEQVDRVAEAFRSGRLSMDQMGSIMEKLAKSPLMTSLIVNAAGKKYLARSGLSDAEKAAGRDTIRRFAAGAIEKKNRQGGRRRRNGSHFRYRAKRPRPATPKRHRQRTARVSCRGQAPGRQGRHPRPAADVRRSRRVQENRRRRNQWKSAIAASRCT